MLLEISKESLYFQFIVLVGISILGGCSSTNLIVEGERAHYTININTFPSRALIYVNGKKIGLSPMIATIERLHSHRQKVAALPLYEHQYQQEVILENGKLPDSLLINMDIPNKALLSKEETTDLACESNLTQLPTLFFDTDIYKLNKDQRVSLQELKCFLEQRGSPQLSIYGLADQHGTETYNYELGLKRAVSAQKALVAEGYPEYQLKTFSYGESQVHNSKLQPSEDEFNRRVYFEVEETQITELQKP